ncbi:hypothetical protein C8F01DRAFT_559757 [Mycena amicta]|nr:hypothetical protein C8F01DRAFT_559757 [Mycena amicta]
MTSFGPRALQPTILPRPLLSPRKRPPTHSRHIPIRLHRFQPSPSSIRYTLHRQCAHTHFHAPGPRSGALSFPKPSILRVTHLGTTLLPFCPLYGLNSPSNGRHQTSIITPYTFSPSFPLNTAQISVPRCLRMVWYDLRRVGTFQSGRECSHCCALGMMGNS